MTPQTQLEIVLSAPEKYPAVSRLPHFVERSRTVVTGLAAVSLVTPPAALPPHNSQLS